MMPHESPSLVASRIVTMFTDASERTQMAGAIEDAIRGAVAEARAKDAIDACVAIEIVAKDRDSLQAKLAEERERAQRLLSGLRCTCPANHQTWGEMFHVATCPKGIAAALRAQETPQSCGGGA